MPTITIQRLPDSYCWDIWVHDGAMQPESPEEFALGRLQCSTTNPDGSLMDAIKRHGGKALVVIDDQDSLTARKARKAHAIREASQHDEAQRRITEARSQAEPWRAGVSQS
jgi:hypothetical protein